jgi:hypothetical protein
LVSEQPTGGRVAEGAVSEHKPTAWYEGNGEHGLELMFWGDGQGHRIGIDSDSARFSWDDTARVLTVEFTYGAEAAATEMYWRLLEIVPALRKDRR